MEEEAWEPCLPHGGSLPPSPCGPRVLFQQGKTSPSNGTLQHRDAVAARGLKVREVPNPGSTLLLEPLLRRQQPGLCLIPRIVNLTQVATFSSGFGLMEGPVLATRGKHIPTHMFPEAVINITILYHSDFRDINRTKATFQAYFST